MSHIGVSSPLKIASQSLNKYGEAIAVVKEYEIHVPYVMAGEEAEVQPVEQRGKKVYARLLRILKSSLDRIEAPCKHFTKCGGCQLQHLSSSAYYAFKRALLEKPLQELGQDLTSLKEVVALGAYQRRRADFKVKSYKDKVEVGFYEAQSHSLVNLEMCLLLEPPLFEKMEQFRQFLSSWKNSYNISRLQLTKSSTALEAVLFAETALKHKDLLYLKEIGSSLKLGRFMWVTPLEQTLILNLTPIQMQVGALLVDIPPLSFVQATEIGESLIRAEILAALKEDEKVIDLYSGWGAYSLALVQKGHQVVAYEGNGDSIAALHNALKKAGLSHKGRAEQRDLIKSPVLAEQLDQFTFIILNPPRNGAGPQTKEIAKSKVKQVLIVSCNPESFARDARILLKAGYHLKKVVPIDQFYWTYHLECVALFER